MLTTSNRMSQEEFDNWSEPEVRAEFVDGEVILLSPESIRADDVRRLVDALLAAAAYRAGRGTVCGPNILVRLRDGLRRVPDLLFVEDLTRIHPTYLQGAPDLALEVVSPESVHRDWRQKYFEYLQSGVREYWVVDPAHERCEVYSLEGTAYRALEPVAGVHRSLVLPEFWVREEWLWRIPCPAFMELLPQLQS